MIRKDTLRRNVHLLRIPYLFFLIFLSSLSRFSYASDFSIHASKNWQKISQNGENAIYKDSQSNSNETVILQSFRAQGKDADLFRTMTPQKLTEARTRMMASFGLGNYTVLDISRPSFKNSSIKGVVFIESLFRDLQNRDVQMVERQYLANGKMYVVTYLVDAPAIENRKRIDKILNDFRPKLSSFVSANSEVLPPESSAIKDGLFELLNQGSECILPSAFASEIASSSTSAVDNSSSNSAVAASVIGDKKLTASEISQQCNNVPVSKRRTAEDTSFSALAKTALTSPKSCIMGIVDNAWGIVKGAYDIAAAGVKYAFSSSYRSEVNSTVGVVVAEIKKDPKAFAQRIAAEVYNSAKQMVGDYFACLKPSEQIRSFCNLASNLIPAGILAKIVTKAPLTAIEVAKVAKLAKEAVGVEKTAAKVADEVSTMHEASVAAKAADASGDASTASKSVSDVGSADKTSTTLASDDDRISRAQQAVGRDLSPAEQQAVSDAHEVGSGQVGRDGSPAAIGNYTDAQLKEKAEILKDAGFSQTERRTLVENGIVGAQPSADSFSASTSRSLSGSSIASKVQVSQELEQNGYAVLPGRKDSSSLIDRHYNRVRSADDSWHYSKNPPSFAKESRAQFESLIKEFKAHGVSVVVSDNLPPALTQMHTINGQKVLELGQDAASYPHAIEKLKQFLKQEGFSPESRSRSVASAATQDSATALRSEGGSEKIASTSPIGRAASKDPTFDQFLNSPGKRIEPTRYTPQRDQRMRELNRLPEASDVHIVTETEAQAQLSQKEIVAIKKFTRDSEDFNLYLRSVDNVKCDQCDILKSALGNLPVYTGEVYRGGDVPNVILEKYKPGSIVHDPAFISTSRNFQIAEDFLLSPPYGRVEGNPSKTPVMFIYRTRTGRAIENLAISEVRYQKEVVLMPNTNFLVQQVFTKPDGTRVIYLVEQ